jgi:hypothetical protein
VNTPTAPPPLALEPRVRSKWALMAGIWLVQWVIFHVGIAALVEPDQAFDPDVLLDLENLIATLIWASVIAGAQAVFLWPVRRPAPRFGPGISVWFTIGAAGLAAALLSAGIIAAAVDLLWLALFVEPGPASLWAVVATFALSWLIFTPLLVAFARRRQRETARISAGLFLGTLVETVAIIPLDVMVRRKTDCYCGQGTFWALVACGSVGLFALGPAIFLPILGRRRKRWYAGHCDACGYDMSGTPAADRCPECGAGWRS